jgi:hypothetical protein
LDIHCIRLMEINRGTGPMRARVCKLSMVAVRPIELITLTGYKYLEFRKVFIYVFVYF